MATRITNKAAAHIRNMIIQKEKFDDLWRAAGDYLADKDNFDIKVHKQKVREYVDAAQKAVLHCELAGLSPEDTINFAYIVLAQHLKQN